MAKQPRKKRTQKSSASERHVNDFAPFAAGDGLERRDRTNIAIVALVALGVRLIFFYLNLRNNPVFLHPIMDGLYHHEWAERIVGGEFWGDEVFFRAPLYPYFLAALHKISGSSIHFAAITQHVIGTASVVLVYTLSRFLFRPAIALIAAILAALYWPLIYFEGDLLIVTLIIFLDLLALVLLLRALRTDGSHLFLLAGCVLGLSAVARPSILAFLAVLPLALYLHSRDRNDGNDRGRARGRRWAAHTILAWSGAMIVIAPVLVRNYVVGHDVVPIASQGGVNFYIGNNPDSDGATAVVPGTRWDWWGGYEDAVQQAESAEGHSLKPSQVSNHYFKKGFAFLFGSPAQSVPLLAKKFQLFWAGGERSNNKSIYFFWHQSGMGRVPLPGFWLIAPLGIFGGVLLWRKREKPWLLYVFAASYMLGVVAFFVNARFRLPVVPVLIIFAGYGAAYLWHHLRRPVKATPAVVALAALCFVAVDYDFLGFKENAVEQLSIPHYTLGNAYLKMEDADGAIAEYEKALRAYQTYHLAGFEIIHRNVIYNLGRLYYGRNLCARAIPLLERVGGRDQYRTRADLCLGDCYAKENRFDDAIRIFRDVLEAAPQTERARKGLVGAYMEQARQFQRRNDRARALESYQRAKTLDPDNPAIDAEIDALKAAP